MGERSGPGEAARERRERQAAALRANLRRRKQQARDQQARDRADPARHAPDDGSDGGPVDEAASAGAGEDTRGA